MVELTKSEELEVAGNAAFCLACHALDSPVSLTPPCPIASSAVTARCSHRVRAALEQFRCVRL